MEKKQMQHRDAILGYAQELNAYYIQLMENHRIIAQKYGLFCDANEQLAEQVMTTLILKKSFWLNGSSVQQIIDGLHLVPTQMDVA